MSDEQISFVQECVECEAVWMPADETRWQARLIDDGPDERLIFFALGAASTRRSGR
jgi:hypothetical protein